MTNKYKFFKKVDSGKATELDMIEYLDEIAKDYNRLEVLNKDAEQFEIKITSTEIARDLLNLPKSKRISKDFKRFREIINERLSIESNESQIQKTKKSISKIKWSGTQTELIELVKALIENESIEGSQKDILNSFCEMLNFKIKNPDQKIQHIKNRQIGNETKYLDKLKSSLNHFISN